VSSSRGEVDWALVDFVPSETSPESVLSMSSSLESGATTPPIRNSAARHPAHVVRNGNNSVKQPRHFLPHPKWCSRNDGRLLLAPVLDIFDGRVLGMRRKMSRTLPRTKAVETSWE
jgi:hypothetical protein